MSKIKIVADSTCDLSPELIKRYDVEIVPLFVALDDKIYRDGSEITPDDVYAWADEHKTVPKTSAISQEDVRAVFKKYINEGYDIFYTGISSEMSASHNIALRCWIRAIFPPELGIALSVPVSLRRAAWALRK